MNEVKRPKKPLIYYYVIVLALVVLFNLLIMPSLTEMRVKEVDYGTLVVGAALIGTLTAAAMTGGASIPAGAVALFALA